MLLPQYKNFTQEKKIGEYIILLPDPPAISKIANHGLSKEKQKFIRTLLPVDIQSWDKESRLEFESKEWEKRNKGYWFFNNGNIEYITGANYFYINWWKIDIGFPSFVDSDRDWFYWWKYVEDNPKARGGINIENRRGGKTWKGTCITYEAVSKTPNSHGGIQSKTNTDGSKIFQKLVFSWKKLPDFFKPVDIGESYPKTKIEFSEPSKRDTKTQKKEYGLVLDSFIDYENSKEEAYDGSKQLRNYQDEIGKTIEINVDERIKIVKECVMDGSKIIGKILATTTVEEMERKGGKYCKLVWDGADPTKLLPNGETQNGLLRYFKPADYGYRGEDNKGISFIDEYGYSDRQRTKLYIEEQLKAMLNKDDVTSHRRKYPLYIHDCWIQDSKKAVYDTTKIEQQLQHNSTLPNNLLVRGNFAWKDGIKDTEVVWNPTETGKWLIAWMQEATLRNKTIQKYGKKSPANIESGCFGLDPYDNKTTVDNRKSDAASYGLRKYQPMLPYETGIFISEYINRPKLPEIMWEDMILECVFYGWEILIESNKIGTINYFRMRGYDNYLMKRPEETQTDSSKKMEEPGIPMSGDDARLALIHATESYIANKVGLIEEEGKEPYMGKCYFNKLLENWLEFDFDKKWTQFDSMVGAGLAILGSRKHISKKIEIAPMNFFKQYDNTGIESKEIKKI